MSEPTGSPSFEDRMRTLGQEVEGAAGRLSGNESLRGAGDLLARAWGVVLIAVGSWFFAKTTLGLDLPRIPWSELWPLALIGLGGLIVLRAARRRA